MDTTLAQLLSNMYSLASQLAQANQALEQAMARIKELEAAESKSAD